MNKIEAWLSFPQPKFLFTRCSSLKEFIIQHASAIEEVKVRIHRMIDRDASCFEHHYLGIYEGFSSQSGL